MKEWRISDVYQTFFESVKFKFSTVLHLESAKHLYLTALWSTLEENLKQVYMYLCFEIIRSEHTGSYEILQIMTLRLKLSLARVS